MRPGTVTLAENVKLTKRTSICRRSGSSQSDAGMIAVREFHTLCLKNGTDFVLGFSRYRRDALAVALTAFYSRNRNASPLGKLRL